jgi:diguanylate cyclase (GGDEF)-like protein
MSALRPIKGLVAGPLQFVAGENEHMIGRLRVLIVALLTVVPAWRVAIEGFDLPLYRWTLGINSAIFLLSIALVLLHRNFRYAPWQGRASSVVDVSLITSILLTYTLVVGPVAGMLNRNTFPIYCVALMSAGLRLDYVAVALAGVAAFVGYGLVVTASVLHPDSAGMTQAELMLALIDQSNRFVVLFVCTLVALAVVRVGVRLVELASLDGVTLALNRAAFDTVLRLEVERARRAGEPFALVIIDLDDLKHINDEFGHARGDEALRLLSRRLSAVLRKGDVIARHGGDEFTVLMPKARADDAVRRMDDLRLTLAEHGLTIGSTHHRLSVTAGVACFPEDGTEELTLYDVADSRLLAGKRAGRDRVIGPERSS